MNEQGRHATDSILWESKFTGETYPSVCKGGVFDRNSIIFGFVFIDQKTSSSHSNSSGLMSGNGLSRLALAAFGSSSEVFEGVSVAG